jgi:hypothetical protein
MASVLVASTEARAWYFPEHVVIAHDGITQLPSEIRAVLNDAVSRARGQGVPLCASVDLSLDDVAQRKPLETKMIRAEISVDCIPYAALPALAADHSSSALELLAVLMNRKAIEISSAAAFEWARFRAAQERLPNTSLERMSFVHDLDVAFYFIDPGYELRAQATRTHFVDADRRLDELVRDAATTGSVDKAFAQFLAHHLRSLGLAAHAQVTDAILEHAFAVHFLQDAFAAGHLAMTQETWKGGNAHVRRRHDFFNAKGLAVQRAMNVEPCATLVVGSLETGLMPCWVTSGDGYLGVSADASDRIHAARAVAKIELEFALALDPARVVAAVEALGEREQLAFGSFVDPVPWWTVNATERRKLRASAARTVRLVRGGAAAIERLRAVAPTAPVEADTAAQPGLFDPRVLAMALDPCVPRSDVDPALLDEADVEPCAATQSPALGTVGVSLIRPLLVEWPTSQVDASRLEGESKEDLGWAAQLLANANAGALFAPHAPVDFFAPAVGVSAGLSYRWGTYLPGRLNRPLAELNVGLSEALHYDSSGSTGGSEHVTFLDQELRWPVLWELLTSYLLPFDLGKGQSAGRVLFFSGMRAHELLTNAAPAFFGVELEAAAFALTAGQGNYPLYSASPELRLYVGIADPTAAQPSFPRTWSPTVGIALTGGYATFL